MAEYQNIKFGVQDRIAVIAIDHPPANAFDRRTLEELGAAIDEATNSGDVKAIVLTGAVHSPSTPIFVAGADIKEIKGMEGDEAAIRSYMEMGQALFNKIEASNKPVIAAINGIALGGGLELALACHMRIAGDSARFGLPEIDLGIMPGWGGTQRLQRVVGKAKAIEIILTGRPGMINAQEAYRINLINKVVPATAVVKEAMGLAKKISEKGGVAIAKALEAINAGADLPMAEGLAVELDGITGLAMTNDAREGILAFIEKRRANFTDS